MMYLPISLSPYLPIFPLERLINHFSDKLGVGHSLNPDGSCHARGRGDIGIGIDLQDINLSAPVNAHIHAGIVPAAKEFKDFNGKMFYPFMHHPFQWGRTDRFGLLIFDALLHPLGLITANPWNPFREFGIIDLRNGEGSHLSIRLHQSHI